FIELRSKLIRSERLAATGQLGVSIAHEINSPLQAITFILNSLRKNYVQDKELTENISLLKEAFGGIRNTVRNLLDLNRPGQDKKQEIKINNVIEKTVALIQTQLKKNKVKINLDLSSKIPNINASPQQLSHVFLNLFNNAIEAMTGISKSKNCGMSHKTDRKINVKTYLNKGSIIIKVADNGPGISEDDLEHIFDPFYTRKKKMGLGVGLSVCNDMIEGHGGTIVAENAPDGSALFTIKLPMPHAKPQRKNRNNQLKKHEKEIALRSKME
ncbi:MAG: GHKL domain-containing protein, partial [Gammaproteobacteria bacterium]|nr:GHKL domain-containing protein [Gammaproteobacteria bacterium]